MADDARTLLLEMGLELGEVNKAVRHFGPGIQVEQAVNWIFEGCPGYVEYAAPAVPPASAVSHPNHQVVPFVGPQSSPGATTSTTGQSQQHQQYGQASQNDNTGWQDAFRGEDNPESSVAKSMLALKDSNTSTSSGSTNSNRYRSDSIITQPANDVWHLDPSDIGRPYSQIPPTEDIPSTDNAGIPTIDVSNINDMQGTSAPRASPVDNSFKANDSSSGLQTPQEDGDADLRRAIELSLQDSNNQGGASADMSRATSRTRAQQQEEDDFAAAMSQSILDADQQASTTSLKDLNPLDTRIRSESDVPVVITSPSSFLAYLPTIMHTFYYNPVFRKVILELEFNYIQPPTFESYTGDAPVFTRSLLPPEKPDCAIKLAALQRLFLFLSLSRRAKTGLADIMDAFGIKVPTAARDRNPLPDMKALHESIGQAWLQYIHSWLEEQSTKGTLAPEQAKQTSDQAKRMLFSQGLSLPDLTEAVLQTDPEPDFFSDENPSLQWTSYAAIQSIPPELNDTYSALDEYFGHAERTAFIVKPGKALYIYNQRAARTGPPAIGPAPPPYSTVSQSEEDPSPFQVESEIYLDRYDWKARKEIMDMRRNVRAGQEQLQKLLLQRERLLTSSKNGKALVMMAAPAPDQAEATNGEANGDGKAILQQAIARLEELADTIDDPERQKSQVLLIQKLKAVVSLIQNQIAKLNDEIAQIRGQITAAREMGKKDIGPYELRTVVMWNGFMGRESMYTYVCSGTASAELEGVKIENPKWWKIASDGTFEVSLDDVLKDLTGVHMIGAGSIAQSYVLRVDNEDELIAKTVPQSLVDAINADNENYLAEVDKVNGKNKLSDEKTIDEGISMETGSTEIEAAVSGHKDVTMQTDEVVATTATTTTDTSGAPTLNLKGGASRRRMSVSSDTGSIASTSKVRLDDWEDEGDSESFKETVELGFPVKLKKAFKVVKDVGKIGGKPTWLDPALPLKPEMATCDTCKSHMEYLLQMNCPLDDLAQAIYRTFYVYTCRKATCLKDATTQGVKVHRVQLPAENPYYELQEEAAQSKAQKFRDKQYAALCPTCKMEHSDPCPCKPWNEWLIETGAEDVEEEEEAPITTDDIEERIKNATLHKEELSTEDTNEPDTRTAVDAAFLKFQERLYSEPDQILRYYYRDAETEPLWVSDQRKSRPSSVPKCACGAERKVEFQIMPPILSILGVDDLDKDSLDFGTIIVYTCTDSCTISKPPPESVFEGELAVFTPPSGWSEEVGFVQNFSQQGVRFQGV